MTRSRVAMKASAIAIVQIAPAVFTCTILTTTASKHHAVTSSTAAQVRVIAPIRERCMRRSVRIRASTGNAVTDIDMPRNSENEVNETLREERRGYRYQARDAPARNGTAMRAGDMGDGEWTGRRGQLVA